MRPVMKWVYKDFALRVNPEGNADGGRIVDLTFTHTMNTIYLWNYFPHQFRARLVPFFVNPDIIHIYTGDDYARL